MNLLSKAVVLALLALPLFSAAGAQTPATQKKAAPATSAASKKAITTSKAVPAKTAQTKSGQTASSQTRPATASKPSGTTKPTAQTRQRYYPSAHKGATSSKRGPASASSVRPASRVTWRTRQLQPDPARYKEIQQALVSKGYLSSEPNGVWDQQSADALKRFQEDQKIDATGKINSLSLIALGLGPKRETTAAMPPPATAPQPEERPAPPPDSN